VYLFPFTKEELKQNFAKAADAYLNIFCEKHGYGYTEAYWIADEPGGLASVADLFVDMRTIMYDIDNDVQNEEFEKWYSYCERVRPFHGTEPNFKAWEKGCHRLSDSEIERAEKAIADFDKIIVEIVNKKEV